MRQLKMIFFATLIMRMAVAAELPLTRVALFASGVGYFEREGAIQGPASVELTFRTAQINDLLKSLVIQEAGGGSLGPITYAPQEPLERTLRAFAIDLSDNPSLRQLWERLRGAPVRVTTRGGTIEGTAFGTELRKRNVGGAELQEEILYVLSKKGLVPIVATDIKAVEWLDPKIAGDVQKALAAINQARDSERRTVTLAFKEAREYRVRVGYLLETPVWKTTYRLLVSKEGLQLQGWALVENTTEEDWSNVRMALISGRPVSFTQNLYQPLYVERPQMPVSVTPAARPRAYEGAVERKLAEEEDTDRALRRGAGFGGAPAAAARPRAAAPPAPEALAQAPQAEQQAFKLATAIAAGEQLGALFQYVVEQLVTIPRQRSAMIPLLNQKIEGEKLSIYNQNADVRHPMHGLRLKNTTALHLMAGPITVFESEAYAGDALIEDIPPGDERLIAYAMDLAVEVEARAQPQTERLLAAKIVHGLMTLTLKSRRETTYYVRNNASEARTLVIEHPVQPGWEIVEPKEIAERTPNVYRLRLVVEPEKEATLHVVEDMARQQEVALLTDTRAPRLYVSQPELSDKIKAALQRLVQLQNELAALRAQLTESERRIKEIEQEQDRIRKNMHELDRNSELYKQYVDKLTKQEAEFDRLRQQQQTFRAQEAAKQQEIATFVNSLNLE